MSTVEQLGGERWLSDEDLRVLSLACRTMLTILLDGRWHNTQEFIRSTDGKKDPMRRVRQLRQLGFVIQVRKVPGHMGAEYRLVGRKTPIDRERYMHSSEWEVIASKVKKRDQHRCRNCESIFDLQVHHLTYKRLGSERMEDLITLCAYCHAAVHKRFLK